MTWKPDGVTRRKRKHRERLSELDQEWYAIGRSANIHEIAEVDRNDLSRRKVSNKMLILRDYIVSAASEINASGGNNNDNPTNLGVSDFSLVAATLDTNNAYKFMSGIEGMDRFGTGPVRSAYFMLSSTELQPDLDALTGSGFISQWNYYDCGSSKTHAKYQEPLKAAA